MKFLLLLFLWITAASPAFAMEADFRAVHEAALKIVRSEKIAPPLVAFAFAAANKAGSQAYEQNARSKAAYAAAFLRIWDRMPGGKSLAEAFVREQAHRVSQEAARSGFTLADQLWDSRAAQFLDSSRGADGAPYGESGWVPTPPEFRAPLLPHWGKMDLWAATNNVPLVNQLKPPAVQSGAFLRDLLEVRELGGLNSRKRTAEQTLIAKFWAAGGGTVTPPGMWIEITLQLVERRKLSFEQALATLTEVSAAMSDAGVLCWHTKFTHQVWRPVTAIQRLVPSDRAWQPLLDTPPFPAYVSGHSSFSAAAATVITARLGASTPFEVISEGAPGSIRRFDNAEAAAAEAGLSRIYGGIHYGADNTDGLYLGRLAACAVLGEGSCI